MSKLLEEFQEYLKKMNQYEHVLTLLYWDMKTCHVHLRTDGGNADRTGQTGRI